MLPLLFGLSAVMLTFLWMQSFAQGLVIQGEIPCGHATTVQSRMGTVQFHRFVGPAMWHAGRGSGRGVIMVSMVSSVATWPISYVNEAGFTSIRVPHWVFIVAATAGGAATCISVCFSLRTLLVATTFVALFLGLAI